MTETTAVTDGTLEYRVGEVEKTLKELRGEVSQSIKDSEVGRREIISMLTTYQSTLPKEFVTLREVTDKFTAQQKQIDENRRSIDALEARESTRGWAIASGMALGLLAFVTAIVAAIIGLHPG